MRFRAPAPCFHQDLHYVVQLAQVRTQMLVLGPGVAGASALEPQGPGLVPIGNLYSTVPERSGTVATSENSSPDSWGFSSNVSNLRIKDRRASSVFSRAIHLPAALRVPWCLRCGGHWARSKLGA